jgi:hypothetical protein
MYLIIMSNNRYPLDILVIFALIVITVISIFVLQNQSDIETLFAEEEESDVLGIELSHRNKLEDGKIFLEVENEIYNSEFYETTNINKGNVLSDYGIDIYSDNKYESNYITFETSEFVIFEFLPSQEESIRVNIIGEVKGQSIIEYQINGKSFQPKIIGENKEIIIPKAEVSTGQINTFKFQVIKGSIEVDSIEITDSSIPQIKELETVNIPL